MYKTVVLIDKQQKEKDKKKQRGKYSSITVSDYDFIVLQCIHNFWSIVG